MAAWKLQSPHAVAFAASCPPPHIAKTIGPAAPLTPGGAPFVGFGPMPVRRASADARPGEFGLFKVSCTHRLCPSSPPSRPIDESSSRSPRHTNDIDSVVKRGVGHFSPQQKQATSNDVYALLTESHDSHLHNRSFSDLSNIETVCKRGTGSCSPRRRESVATCFQSDLDFTQSSAAANQDCTRSSLAVRQDCVRMNLMDIDQGHNKRSAGECSPRSSPRKSSPAQNPTVEDVACIRGSKAIKSPTRQTRSTLDWPEAKDFVAAVELDMDMKLGHWSPRAISPRSPGGSPRGSPREFNDFPRIGSPRMTSRSPRSSDARISDIIGSPRLVGKHRSLSSEAPRNFDFPSGAPVSAAEGAGALVRLLWAMPSHQVPPLPLRTASGSCCVQPSFKNEGFHRSCDQTVEDLVAGLQDSGALTLSPKLKASASSPPGNAFWLTHGAIKTPAKQSPRRDKEITPPGQSEMPTVASSRVGSPPRYHRGASPNNAPPRAVSPNSQRRLAEALQATISEQSVEPRPDGPKSVVASAAKSPSPRSAPPEVVKSPHVAHRSSRRGRSHSIGGRSGSHDVQQSRIESRTTSRSSSRASSRAFLPVPYDSTQTPPSICRGLTPQGSRKSLRLAGDILAEAKASSSAGVTTPFAGAPPPRCGPGTRRSIASVVAPPPRCRSSAATSNGRLSLGRLSRVSSDKSMVSQEGSTSRGSTRSTEASQTTPRTGPMQSRSTTPSSKVDSPCGNVQMDPVHCLSSGSAESILMRRPRVTVQPPPPTQFTSDLGLETCRDSFEQGSSTTECPSSSECPLTNRSAVASSATSSPTAGGFLPTAVPQPSYSLEAAGYTLSGASFSIPGWVAQHAYTVIPLSPTRVFFGIFDGYGIHGNHLAKAVRDCFNETAPLLPGAGSQSLSAYFKQAFAYAEQESSLTGFLVGDSGTSVTVGVVDITARLAAMANVGSSMVIVADRSGITYQSKSHTTRAKLELPTASSRSVGGVHSIQRSLSNPVITTDIMFTPESVLTVASGGVWQKVGANDVASMSLSADSQMAASEMVLKAKARSCADQNNGTQEFSAVVVRSISAAAGPGLAKR